MYRGVYSVGHGVLSREAQFLAAVFATREGVLSHLAATELHGVWRYRASLIDVVGLHKRRNEPGVRSHRVNHLHPRDVTSRKGIPVTSMAALHAAGSAGTKSRGELRLVIALEQRNLPEPKVSTDLLGFEVGFHWPELKLAVEIDGDGHGRPRTRNEDERRDLAPAEVGYEVLRFRDDAAALAEAASAVADRVGRPRARSSRA